MWRDAPLLVELGVQTALALHETLERLNALRSVGGLLGLILPTVAFWVSMFVGSWAARATGPRLRTLAELRALPVARAPGGAVGNWLE